MLNYFPTHPSNMDNLERYQFIQSNCSKFSIKHFEISVTDIISAKIKRIKEILENVESVELLRCFLKGDIYERVLMFCKKLKR